MGKQDILEILRHYKKEVANEYKISKIGIFGSISRGGKQMMKVMSRL